MFYDVFSAFFKIIEHNFLMMSCFFCSVDVVFLISDLEFPTIDKGVGISGSCHAHRDHIFLGLEV